MRRVLSLSLSLSLSISLTCHHFQTYLSIYINPLTTSILWINPNNFSRSLSISLRKSIKSLFFILSVFFFLSLNQRLLFQSISRSLCSEMDVNGRGGSSTLLSEEEMDLRRGPWTVEEDLTLINYIATHGEGRWNSLARCAGWFLLLLLLLCFPFSFTPIRCLIYCPNDYFLAIRTHKESKKPNMLRSSSWLIYLWLIYLFVY